MSGTAVTRIADELRRDILSGDIAPDAPLREERLAARFSASRHTVRTALAYLTSTGLAVAEAHRGVRVARFDLARASAMQDLRRAIESEAVEIIRQRHGASWPRTVLAPVEEELQRLADAEGTASAPLPVLRAHSAVHAAIVAASGSSRLIDVHRRLLDEMDLLLLHARDRYDPGELHRQHRRLLADLQREGAPAMRRHLEDTIARMASG